MKNNISNALYANLNLLEIICLGVLICWPVLGHAQVLGDDQQVGKCTDQIKMGSCNYYLCREEQHPCGDSGYYKGFAFKYCQKYFNKTAKKLSQQGNNWLARNALCLQEALDDIPDQQSCGKVKTLAVRTHARCYRQTGFCRLPVRDLFRIFFTISPRSYRPSVFRQALRALPGCKAYFKKFF